MKEKWLGIFLLLGLAGLVFVAPVSALSKLSSYDYDAVLGIDRNGTALNNRYAGAFKVRFFDGFFLPDLAGERTLENVVKTVDIIGANSPTFFLSFSGERVLNEMDMPFRFGYWNGFAGQSENIQLSQLGEVLTAQVPEPAAMLLLGFGLLGLGGLGRKLRK